MGNKNFKERDISYLKYLCLKYPKYSIKQLAAEMNKDISKIFIMIKMFDLPYNWKMKK